MERRAKGLIAIMIAGAQLASVQARADVCDVAAALEAGAPAPCSGLLVPQVDAVIALRCMSEDLPACQADGRLRAAELAAELARVSTTLEAERTKADRIASALDMAAPVAQGGSTWTRTAIWGGTALLVGVVIGALAASRVEAIGF